MINRGYAKMDDVDKRLAEADKILKDARQKVWDKESEINKHELTIKQLNYEIEELTKRKDNIQADIDKALQECDNEIDKRKGLAQEQITKSMDTANTAESEAKEKRDNAQRMLDKVNEKALEIVKCKERYSYPSLLPG